MIPETFDAQITDCSQQMILHPFLNLLLHTAAIIGHLNGKVTNIKSLNHLLTLKVRLVAVSLIPLTVAPFAAGTLNPVPDAILCSTILIHSYIGFQYVYNATLARTPADRFKILYNRLHSVEETS